MDLESTKKLRLDKRLTSRRGWIAASKLEASLEALPDLSDKVAPPEEEVAAAERAPAAVETPPPAFVAAAPPADPTPAASTTIPGDGTPEGGAPV